MVARSVDGPLSPNRCIPLVPLLPAGTGDFSSSNLCISRTAGDAAHDRAARAGPPARSSARWTASTSGDGRVGFSTPARGGFLRRARTGSAGWPTSALAARQSRWPVVRGAGQGRRAALVNECPLGQLVLLRQRRPDRGRGAGISTTGRPGPMGCFRGRRHHPGPAGSAVVPHALRLRFALTGPCSSDHTAGRKVSVRLDGRSCTIWTAGPAGPRRIFQCRGGAGRSGGHDPCRVLSSVGGDARPGPDPGGFVKVGWPRGRVSGTATVWSPGLESRPDMHQPYGIVHGGWHGAAVIGYDREDLGASAWFEVMSGPSVGWGVLTHTTSARGARLGRLRARRHDLSPVGV